ncbi:hypothetical protein [Lentibacillus cibarius]|uniref:DUF2634 domain-containing protein n=1 Tax=Lentibacillus cibarius TaxID=2583219 RepID=A0A5S3QIY1_9BACI|nr:hypothetical protein [Lentibacillus cibarius]TMN21882.1 hypothetical protein FFL34_06960 [Lentibacillus cibarius]
MKWIPRSPTESTIYPRVNVDTYKTDLAMSFDEDGADIIIENGDMKTVSGLDNFIQRLKSVLLANKTELFDYGLFEMFPKSTDQDKFNRECQLLAEALVSHQYSDSKPDNPNGLGYTIESVHSIEYDKAKYTLSVKVKVTGLDNPIQIDVLIPRQLRNT